MIYMDERHLKIVKAILAKYPYTFYVFGSRTKGTHRPLSDLDMCFMEDSPWNVRAHIDEDFEESDLPFTVDIIDWNTCKPDFQAKIAKDLVQISP
jgi:predicted nucleotidyltransferase